MGRTKDSAKDMVKVLAKDMVKGRKGYNYAPKGNPYGKASSKGKGIYGMSEESWWPTQWQTPSPWPQQTWNEQEGSAPLFAITEDATSDAESDMRSLVDSSDSEVGERPEEEEDLTVSIHALGYARKATQYHIKENDGSGA